MTDLAAAIAQAWRIATQRPCGPTFVSMPVDDRQAAPLRHFQPEALLGSAKPRNAEKAAQQRA